jgi:hypothetical protein
MPYPENDHKIPLAICKVHDPIGLQYYLADRLVTFFRNDSTGERKCGDGLDASKNTLGEAGRRLGILEGDILNDFSQILRSRHRPYYLESHVPRLSLTCS